LVLKKTDRKPAQLQPLEAVKEQITSVVRAEKIQALLTQQAQGITAALNSGASITDQAKSLGLEVKVAKETSRTDTVTDRAILEYVFSLPTPAGKPVVGSAKTGSGDYAVVTLDAVKLGTEDKVAAEQRQSVSSMLAGISGDHDFRSYQAHLKEVAKIEHP